ncbi:MAG: prepilin-type N-terminal cleavage/methylation domain-containing protein [Deltaproteobacteria bacterium]|nr:prepilin-type N-terminal cleavage/methylation domain-containing protein [Deltaproteobacteria bacterium]MCL5276865.1 prepilin-type N-terminal cleavage/methylation domain-containing protein [Deltaproteobacteria bacterium]
MTDTSSRKSLEQGFSLLELLVAVAILAVGLISIQSLENQNIDASNYINDLNIGMMLADYRLGEEQIKANFGDFNPPLKSFENEFPSFTVDTAVENGLSLPVDLPIELPGVLVVDVSWKFHRHDEKLMVVDYLPTSVSAGQGILNTQ